jgi:hypothetical protein
MSKSVTIRKRVSTARPKPLPVPLDQPGRLRIGHLMHLYGCSHTTLYARIKNGFIPAPDGRDPRPFWLTATIWPHFAAKAEALGAK